MCTGTVRDTCTCFSLLIIRGDLRTSSYVESTGIGSNSMVTCTGAALSIITGTNKKDDVSAVNCLDSIDLALKMTI